MGSICNYILYDVDDPDVSVDTAMEDGDPVNVALPIDGRYFFEISNAAGTWIIPGENFSEICTCTKLHEWEQGHAISVYISDLGCAHIPYNFIHKHLYIHVQKVKGLPLAHTTLC